MWVGLPEEIRILILTHVTDIPARAAAVVADPRLGIKALARIFRDPVMTMAIDMSTRPPPSVHATEGRIRSYLNHPDATLEGFQWLVGLKVVCRVGKKKPGIFNNTFLLVARSRRSKEHALRIFKTRHLLPKSKRLYMYYDM